MVHIPIASGIPRTYNRPVQQTPSQTPKLSLFGAAPSTGNLGVSALFHSAVAGVFDRYPKADITVFDFGWTRETLKVRLGEQSYEVTRAGANPSKRFWRHDTLANMRLMNRLGGLGNPGVRDIRKSLAVWDVSGGDSFTDLYGVKRFWTTTTPKLIALEAERPLVLLPQTYGPFGDPGLREVARKVTAQAATAWARDERSFQTLQELLGDDFDPSKHRVGVDLAFGLPPTPARDGVLEPKAQAWLQEDDGAVGLNVSGLIYMDPNAAKDRYGFRADYPKLMHGLVQVLLERGERVILVPHVIEPKGNVESDPEACERVRAALTPKEQERVSILKPPYTAAEVKSVLARMKWFCGTRMHSTIGALSSGVPTAAVAYSLKFQGVFETCDQASGVCDPRELKTGAALTRLLEHYENRDLEREILQRALPGVKGKAAEQMAHLLEVSGL